MKENMWVVKENKGVFPFLSFFLTWMLLKKEIINGVQTKNQTKKPSKSAKNQAKKTQ